MAHVRSQILTLMLFLPWQASAAAPTGTVPCSVDPNRLVTEVPVGSLPRQINRILPAVRLAGTSTGGGGGGSGVVCFDGQSTAAQVTRNHGRMTDRQRSQIRSLDVTDLYEKGDMSFFAQPNPGEDPKTYLHRILQNALGSFMPSFLEVVHAALEKVELTEAAALPSDFGFVDDLGDRNPIPKNCSYTNIAYRTIDIVDGVERPRVRLNRDYFSRLGLSPDDRIKNQAALMLHEALYLLGHELQQRNSNDTRALTRFLMSHNLQESARLSPSMQSASIMLSLPLFHFEDLPVLRSNRALSPDKAAIHDGYRLLSTRINRDAARINRGEMNYAQAASNFATAESDADAFVFQAISTSTLGTRTIDFFQLLEQRHDSTSEYQTVCKRIEHELSEFAKAPFTNHPEITENFRRARRFCREVLRISP